MAAITPGGQAVGPGVGQVVGPGLGVIGRRPSSLDPLGVIGDPLAQASGTAAAAALGFPGAGAGAGAMGSAAAAGVAAGAGAAAAAAGGGGMGVPGGAGGVNHALNLALLEASVRNMPQTKDSDRPKAYTPVSGLVAF